MYIRNDTKTSCLYPLHSNWHTKSHRMYVECDLQKLFAARASEKNTRSSGKTFCIPS